MSFVSTSGYSFIEEAFVFRCFTSSRGRLECALCWEIALPRGKLRITILKKEKVPTLYLVTGTYDIKSILFKHKALPASLQFLHQPGNHRKASFYR